MSPNQLNAYHKTLMCRTFRGSGRLDSNQRPLGPQPERWGSAQLMGPVFAGLLASEFVPVALNLFPKLFRERVFGPREELAYIGRSLRVQLPRLLSRERATLTGVG